MKEAECHRVEKVQCYSFVCVGNVYIGEINKGVE